MRKLALLFLVVACQSFGAVITGGYIGFVAPNSGSLQATGDGLQLGGFFDGGSTFFLTPIPYAMVLDVSPAFFDIVNGAGEIDGIPVAPAPFAPYPLDSVNFQLTGPTVYAPDQPVVSTSFTLNGHVTINSLGIATPIPECVPNPITIGPCEVPITGSGTVTFTWTVKPDYYGPGMDGYYSPQVLFTFIDPATVPEPATWLLGMFGILATVGFRLYQFRLAA